MSDNRITGHRPAAATAAHEHKGIPRSWSEVKNVKATIDDLIAEDAGVELRLKSGRMLGLDASDKVTEFVKKGYFKLYEDPKAEEEANDETGEPEYTAGYYLVPTSKFDILDAQLEKFSTRALSITKAISTEMTKYGRLTHASRVNRLSDFNLPKIKAEIAAETPKIKTAIVAFEQAVEKFKHDTQHLDYPDSQVYLMLLAKEALKSVAPHIDAPLLDDLTFAKDVIRANELLLKRPEIEAVDGAGEIRISVNTDTLVKNGGDYSKLQKEISALLQNQLITDKLSFDRNNNDTKVMEAALKLVEKAVGAKNVDGGLQIGDYDFPDRKRGTEVLITVSKDKVAAARQVASQIRALFAPHGYDMKHFVVNVRADRN